LVIANFKALMVFNLHQQEDILELSIAAAAIDLVVCLIS